MVIFNLIVVVIPTEKPVTHFNVNVKENQSLEKETPERPGIAKPGTEAPVLRLLAEPYGAFLEKLKRAGLDLKESVVVETWGLTGQKVDNFTVYSGLLGTAFLLVKSYEVTKNEIDLALCSHIIKACDSASFDSRDVTFLCGRAGACALGAVVAKRMDDGQMLHYYLTKFKDIRLSKDLPDELLYGRSGYLWACLFINRHVSEGTISPAETNSVVQEIIKNGRNMGGRGRSPLMFEWHGKKYWGAAHGLAGIMHVLMHFELKPDESEDVKETLRYMIKNRLPSGNYPSKEEEKRKDLPLHWCHGAPGIALTLVKAAEVFGDKEFVQAAMDAAEVVWNRGLLKRVGLCHGISGNAYVFLALYRLTGEVKYLHRAKAFSSFLLEKAHKLVSERQMHGGDNPYSLFEGAAGMAFLFLDMVQPSDARFPAYEI